MYKYLLILFFLPLHLVMGQASKYDADVTSEDQIINAMYASISGAKGQKRDWDRLKFLFAPGAQLIPTNVVGTPNRTPCYLSIEQFIEQGDEFLTTHGFFEKEISRRTETFGSLSHVWSTFASSWTADGKPFAQGINSVQLLNDGKRWWIINLYWVGESEDIKLPKKYLR
jgi:hypothetical protein